MRAAAFAFMLMLVGCSGAANEQIGDARTEPSIEQRLAAAGTEHSIEQRLEAAIEGLEARAARLDGLHDACDPYKDTLDLSRCQELQEQHPSIGDWGPPERWDLQEWWDWFDAVCESGGKRVATQMRCDALEDRLHALEGWRYDDLVTAP